MKKKNMFRIKAAFSFKSSLIFLLLFTLIIFITVGYSSLNTELNISGEAYMRIASDTRFTACSLNGTTNGGLEDYPCKYGKNTFLSGVSLPALNSTVTYNVTVTNFVDLTMILDSINEVNFNNPNIEYVLSNISIDAEVPNMDSLTFQITFKYKSSVSVLPENTSLGSNLQFIFSEGGYILTVNSSGGTWSGTTPQLLQSGNTVTVNKPVKTGSLFTGWTITGDGSFTDETIFTIGTSDTTLTANWQPYSSMFSYVVGGNPSVEGTDYIIVDNGDSTNWKIKFLKSGTFTPAINMTIDVFLVGGGGGGTAAYSTCGAGGGGYTTTAVRKVLTANTGYPIVVGSGVTSGQGGTSSAFSVSALGGYSGGSSTGGNGGSGGAGTASGVFNGGTDGSYGGGNAGTGQRTTTREFGEVTGTLYAGGGGATRSTGEGLGGAGGGGTGGINASTSPQPGTANTGGGGGAQLTANAVGGGKSGGSGIVVIRNTKLNTVGNTSKFIFAYSGSYEIINASTDSWKVKFLTSGTFIPLSTASIDAFLVGGGGGGAGYVSAYSVAGGGGKTLTTSLTINSGTEYPIVVGLGGRGGSAGGNGSAGAATTAFTCTATAGGAGTSSSGGSGGSGGARTGSASFNGGTNGSNGLGSTPGTGQGTTTREFGEVTGALYSAGGGATRSTGQGLAGDDSGGNGGNLTTHPGGYDAPANRGGGGGGSSNSSYTGGAGGSGVVVIRRHP